MYKAYRTKGGGGSIACGLRRGLIADSKVESMLRRVAQDAWGRKELCTEFGGKCLEDMCVVGEVELKLILKNGVGLLGS